jgi:hypothetical protein
MVCNELMCERILALSRVFTEDIVLPLCSLGHLAETAEGDGRHETEMNLPTRVASCAAVQWAQDAHDKTIVRLGATDAWRGQLLNTLEALVQREEHVRTVLHEALTQTRADPLCEDSYCDPCCCSRMHQCAIAVLYAAGYVPEYSSGGRVRAAGPDAGQRSAAVRLGAFAACLFRCRL